MAHEKSTILPPAKPGGDSSLEAVVSEMERLSSKLLSPNNSQQTEDERALCRLAAECNILSDQILGLLEKIKPKDAKSKRQSAWAALKNKLHEREKLELEKRLENCRSQLELQLSYLTRSHSLIHTHTLSLSPLTYAE